MPFFFVVNIPTKITETAQTAINHILNNITTEKIKPGVLQTDIRDHFPTFTCISKHKISHNKKYEMFKRNLKNIEPQSFADCLKNYFDNLEHINKENINKVCEAFL